MDDQEYFLEMPITVAADGKAEDCQVVTLVSPVKKFIQKTYKLQQYFMKAQFQSAELFSSLSGGDEEKPERSDEEKKLEPQQVMQMLLCSDVNINDVIKEFERLAKLGAVTVADKKIHDIQWTALDDSDKEGLMAKYVAFFISTLAMKSFIIT